MSLGSTTYVMSAKTSTLGPPLEAHSCPTHLQTYLLFMYYPWPMVGRYQRPTTGIVRATVMLRVLRVSKAHTV
jgi:hypothetical protein